MNVVIDTNALIRYFSDDDPLKADRVEELLEDTTIVSIPDVVLPELEYVLTKEYHFSREKMIEIYKFLISLNKLILTAEAKKAIKIYTDSQLDMADCIIAAHSLKGKLASFDKKLLQTDAVQPFWEK